MVISESTLETINYVKDVDFELNIKIILFLFSLFYLYLAYNYSKNCERDTTYKDFLWGFSITYQYLYIFLSPLFILFFKRTTTLETLYLIIVKLYTGLAWVVGIIVIVYLTERGLDKFFGIRLRKSSGRESRSIKDYRRD